MGKIYVNENQIMLPEMLEIYKPEDYDWMSYQITRNNVLTLHHILEMCNGGLTTLDNLALVSKKGHRVLNIIHTRDLGLYIEWNDLFRYINDSKQKPDEYAQEYSRKLKKYSQNIIYK